MYFFGKVLKTCFFPFDLFFPDPKSSDPVFSDPWITKRKFGFAPAPEKWLSRKPAAVDAHMLQVAIRALLAAEAADCDGDCLCTSRASVIRTVSARPAYGQPLLLYMMYAVAPDQTHPTQALRAIRRSACQQD